MCIQPHAAVAPTDTRHREEVRRAAYAGRSFGRPALVYPGLTASSQRRLLSSLLVRLIRARVGVKFSFERYSHWHGTDRMAV